MGLLASIVLMIILCTFGLFAIVLVILCMGLAGAPGAIFFELGRKKLDEANDDSSSCSFGCLGILVSAVGQSYVVGAYVVFSVSLLRNFLDWNPQLSAWPLWLAALFHSAAPSIAAMSERTTEPTSQSKALGLVFLASISIFVVCLFAPSALEPIYNWVPYYNESLELLSESKSSSGNNEYTEYLAVSPGGTESPVFDNEAELQIYIEQHNEEFPPGTVLYRK